MMKALFILPAAVLLFSCGNEKATKETATAAPAITDSVLVAPATQTDADAPATPATKDAKHAEKSEPSQRSTTDKENTERTSSTSTSSNPARRSGMSKTAKGAIIGGVVGAGTGAVVNKKNRAAGAVVGGVVGAGAGAIIGHEADKRDGRQ